MGPAASCQPSRPRSWILRSAGSYTMQSVRIASGRTITVEARIVVVVVVVVGAAVVVVLLVVIAVVVAVVEVGLVGATAGLEVVAPEVGGALVVDEAAATSVPSPAVRTTVTTMLRAPIAIAANPTRSERDHRSSTPGPGGGGGGPGSRTCPN